MDENGIVCGVDEAGRGPLAGPVFAAAVVLDPQNPIMGLKDSKKLSAKRRNVLFDAILAQSKAYAIAFATVEEIDTLNILRATMLAMQRAVNALPIVPHLALIDGDRGPSLPCCAKYIIKGDVTEPAISAASILAKVSRDRALIELDRFFPYYGFAKHVGYGTRMHLAALAEYGPCPHHRKSFAPVKNSLL